MKIKINNAVAAATFALCLGAVACGGVQKPTTNPTGEQVKPPVEEVELDPTLIKSDGNDGGKTEVVESSDVFKSAQSAFRKRQYDEALKHYAVIIEHFQDSDYYLAALYNSGLAYDFLKRHEEACQMYRRVIKEFRGRSEATDAFFRLAASLGELEQHAEVLEVLDETVERTGLTLADRIEAQTRRGDALYGLGKFSEAEAAYRQTLMTHKRADPDNALPDDSYFVVGAQYGVARVYQRLFEDIKFKLPVERMEKDLDDKIQLFQQAQGLFIRTIRKGHPYWTTASRYQIANMYEAFYADLLASEIPELTDEEAELYFEELREKLRPLMEQALQYYEKTIILSERQGVDNEYTERTQKALERLKGYLTDPEAQARDEDAVRAGENVGGLGDDAPKPPAPKPMGDGEGDEKDPDESDKDGPDSIKMPKRDLQHDSHRHGAG